MLGSWSLRIPSLVGAPVLCSQLSLGVLALLAPPACPDLVPEQSDKPGLNVLLGEAGFVRSGVCLAPALRGAGSAGAGAEAAGDPRSTARGPPVSPRWRMRGQVWGVPCGVPVSSGFSLSSPCRSPRAGSEPAQVPAWQCRPGRAELSSCTSKMPAIYNPGSPARE